MEKKHTLVVIIFLLLALGALAALGLTWNSNDREETFDNGDPLNTGINNATGTETAIVRNTPEDIGFPTTKDPSDFVPPEGWVKYRFTTDKMSHTLEEASMLFTESYSGFEFWYPREFGSPETLRAQYSDYPVPKVSISIGSPYLAKYEGRVISIDIQRYGDDSDSKGLFNQSDTALEEGRSVKKIKTKGNNNEYKAYRYLFIVDGYLYDLGFGIDEFGNSGDWLITNIVTSGGLTRDEVFRTFFKSFRFVER